VFWVSRTGRFVYANDAACRRLGIDRRDLTQRSVQHVAPEWNGPRWEELWSLLEQHSESRFSTHVATPGGIRFPIGVAASRVVIEAEPYVFAIGRDLTEEMQNRAAVEALNATLEQRVRERTDELGRANAELKAFGYSVSHDLRAPLRHVSGYLEMLREELAKAVTQAAGELIQRVLERVAFMNALIDGLLKLSQVTQQPIAMQDIDLSAMARAVAGELARGEPARRVEISVEDGMRVRGDPALMHTLLQNLIGNAWKYSRNTAAARIAFAREELEGEPAYAVRDNGAGFDRGNSGRLFGAFQRLHSSAEFDGIGIGLATCKRIVERHGGRIRADSRPGEGAVFFFTLAQPHAG
jgi:PAS domain S-box-containing protein